MNIVRPSRVGMAAAVVVARCSGCVQWVGATSHPAVAAQEGRGRGGHPTITATTAADADAFSDVKQLLA